MGMRHDSWAISTRRIPSFCNAEHQLFLVVVAGGGDDMFATIYQHILRTCVKLRSVMSLTAASTGSSPYWLSKDDAIASFCAMSFA